jgi:hypothetical protein
MVELIDALGSGDEAGLTRLRELCEYCPACTLAAIRQSGLLSYEKPGHMSAFEYDYQKDRNEFWATHNEANAKDYRY